jgi:hypothetical protein
MFPFVLLGLFGLLLMCSVPGLLANRWNKYTLTTKRIIIESGFFRPSLDELPMNNAISVALERNFIAALFDYGTVIIHFNAGQTLNLPNAPAPMEFIAAIRNRINENTNVRRF